MPSWNEVLHEIRGQPATSSLDLVRRKYLKELSEHTGRNTIAYYSGFLSAQSQSYNLSINDSDKNAFMSAIHGLDRSKGLDLILHTPGGEVAAAESLVDYLRQMFGKDVRAIVPQLAMSAGTMIACSCKSIVMGKQSNLGPMDPQLRGLPAHEVISEFDRAASEIQLNHAKAAVWQFILSQYSPTFLGECQKAIDLADKIVNEWLVSGMFNGQDDAEAKAKSVTDYFGSHDATLNHGRHIHMDECVEHGLVIEKLEDDQKLQDLVLTIHHAYMHTISMANVVKIVENQMGIASIESMGQ